MFLSDNKYSFNNDNNNNNMMMMIIINSPLKIVFNEHLVNVLLSGSEILLLVVSQLTYRFIKRKLVVYR